MFLLRLGQVLFGGAACTVGALALWLVLKRNQHAPLFMIVSGGLIVVFLLTLATVHSMLIGAAILLSAAGAGLLAVAAGRPEAGDRDEIGFGDSTTRRRR